MRIPVLIVAASFALAACSSTGAKKLATCDGKHLRPANPYGTVLAPSAEGAAAPSAEGTPETTPKTLSSLASPESFGSCA
jgi:type IV secretion system protein VirB7